jgi:mRNA degradation ribonuclease J1/J2
MYNKCQYNKQLYIIINLFYHSTKSFQFLNSCEENDRAFVLSSQKMQNNYHQLQQMYIVNHLLINIKMNRKICFFASCKICG